ncbi:MAG: hypothetical protein WC356_02495 [Candidatus Micrarchaeia archaeon]|jgi:uncharacterized membrane protein YjjB (DUF3815 family)
MGITKEAVKIGKVVGALLIGFGAGFAWHFQTPTDPIYYPIGLGILVALIAYIFFTEKNLSGGLANNLRSIVMGLFGAFLGYMWYMQFKDLTQGIIVGIISMVLLVLLGKKAFTKGGED